MKKLLTIAAIVVLAFAVVSLVGCSGGGTPAATPSSSAGGSSSTSPAAGGTAVSIANFAFSPAEVTIKAGDTVTWTNNDSAPHTVTGADFDSGQLAQGATFSQTFPTAGSFSYKCTIHPSMAPGKVTVQ
jgi:plastocyanin